MQEQDNNFSIDIGFSADQQQETEKQQDQELENQFKQPPKQSKNNKYVKKDDQLFIKQFEIEECLYWMFQQKKESISNFDKIAKIGNLITKYTKEENLTELEAIIKQNIDIQPYMTPYIEDAFDQIVTLRFDNVIQFYLERGLNIEDNFTQSLIILVKTSKLFPNDPPTETLRLLLKYGADPNQIEKENKKYRTPLHIACKYGIAQFVAILCACDKTEINPVDRKQKTPMGYVKERLDKGKQYKIIYQFLNEKGGVVDWKNTK